MFLQPRCLCSWVVANHRVLGQFRQWRLRLNIASSKVISRDHIHIRTIERELHMSSKTHRCLLYKPRHLSQDWNNNRPRVLSRSTVYLRSREMASLLATSRCFLGYFIWVVEVLNCLDYKLDYALSRYAHNNILPSNITERQCFLSLLSNV